MPLRQESGGWGESIRTIAYAVLIALVIRTFAFEPFNIPTGSMIPTLLIGDYLFVSKFSYGYSKHSLPFSLPLIPGRVMFSPPERGDVVVFKKPSDNKTDYIKRVIGLPGDRIQVKEGRLYINSQIVERTRTEPFAYEEGSRVALIPQYVETLPNGRKHVILELSDRGPLDDTPEYVVPAGHYFAMGDNRDNSQDSRVLSEVGYIPAENLVGKAQVLFFSTSGQAQIWEFWKWPKAIRFGRLLQGIH